MKDTLFKVGDILRYGSGSTALMRVSFVSEKHGGAVARYYGQQFFGGACGAYHEKCQLATPQERDLWYEEGKKTTPTGQPIRTPWATFLRREHGSGIVGAVED